MWGLLPVMVYMGGGGGVLDIQPKKGTIFMLQVYERVGISLVEVNERVEKSVILVGNMT